MPNARSRNLADMNEDEEVVFEFHQNYNVYEDQGQEFWNDTYLVLKGNMTFEYSHAYLQIQLGQSKHEEK